MHKHHMLGLGQMGQTLWGRHTAWGRHSAWSRHSACMGVFLMLGFFLYVAHLPARAQSQQAQPEQAQPEQAQPEQIQSQQIQSGQEQQVKEAGSAWRHLSQKLEDGRTVSQIQLLAKNAVYAPDGTRFQLILAIECRGSESTAALALKDHALTIQTNMSRITFSADDEKPRKQRFHRSADNKALLIRRNREAIKFVQNLYGKKTLRISAPFARPVIEGAEFVLGDIKTATAPIAKACNWPLKKQQ